MRSDVEYRGYTIFHDGFEFVAEPQDPDESIFEIGSHSIELAVQTIDELWSYVGSTKRFSEKAVVPTWFQDWLDAGASGRIRITKPESFEFEHLKRQKPSRGLKGRRGQFIISAVACAFAFVATGMAFADVDGNGRIDGEDVALLIDNLHMRAPRSQLTRLVEIDGKDFVMTAVPSTRDDCDYRITLVANEKQPAL